MLCIVLVLVPRACAYPSLSSKRGKETHLVCHLIRYTYMIPIINRSEPNFVTGQRDLSTKDSFWNSVDQIEREIGNGCAYL